MYHFISLLEFLEEHGFLISITCNLAKLLEPLCLKKYLVLHMPDILPCYSP